MISSIVHTYNEAKNLNRCLSSLTWTDEIVLIDMGSTDGTLDIAKNFTDKIYHHPYMGFVEPARNFGINKAKGDWLLIIDADEEVPRQLNKKIKQLVKKTEKNINYYLLPRKNIIFSKWVKHSDWWPDYQIRLFKKGTVTWSEKIHDIPLTTGRGKDFEAQEELAIIHYHYISVDQYLERLNRYTLVQAKELYLNNKKATMEMLIINPVNEFVKRFFLKEGYKDGLHGLALSLLQSVSEFIVVLKLWELDSFTKESINLENYQKLLSKETRIKKYWLYYELLNKPHTILQDIFWKILRKLNS